MGHLYHGYVSHNQSVVQDIKPQMWLAKPRRSYPIDQREHLADLVLSTSKGYQDSDVVDLDQQKLTEKNIIHSVIIQYHPQYTTDIVPIIQYNSCRFNIIPRILGKMMIHSVRGQALSACADKSRRKRCSAEWCFFVPQKNGKGGIPPHDIPSSNLT